MYELNGDIDYIPEEPTVGKMRCPRCEDTFIDLSSRYPFCDKCQKDIIKTLIDTFREDEYDFIYDYIDGNTYGDLRKEIYDDNKGEN